jgi:anti-sigma B factor antagonist
MPAVTFLGPTGLTVLISAYRTTRRTGARLALIAPSPAVQEMLRITGVDRIADACPAPAAGPR